MRGTAETKMRVHGEVTFQVFGFFLLILLVAVHEGNDVDRDVISRT